MEVATRSLFDAPPPPGEWVEVAAGVFWARLPLPFRLDHVNVYLIDDGRSWNIVDTGISSELSMETWDRLLAGRVANRTVSKIITTHHHPDHVGLASWLAERLDAEVVMSGTEYLLGLTYWLDPESMKIDHYREFYRRRGLALALAEPILSRGSRYRSITCALPFSFRRVVNGDQLKLGTRCFEVITAPGHAPEQLMLYSREENILLSADQVMLGITPNVSVSPRTPADDVLGAFLVSIQKLADLVTDETMILPGHHGPFRGLAARVGELKRHHEERLRAILDACRSEPRSVADLLEVMFRHPIDDAVMELAFGEACAHVNRLLSGSQLVRRCADTGIESYVAL